MTRPSITRRHTSQKAMHTSAMGLLDYGAMPNGERTELRLWAPKAKRVEVRLESGARIHMLPEPGGNFAVAAPIKVGDRYFYELDGGRPLPDPVSRLLPEGIHGPTEVVDPLAFRWTDEAWRGLHIDDYVIYELHVGTFTAEGTFDGVIGKLGYLKQLGVTVLEIMPVSAFPGRRNWGYDGVAPYAVHASYGGPDGLKRLVNAAHKRGLAVILDVVYNHLGPEGNYFRQFGPYFNHKHTTPWGDAINFDGPGCETVRRYFINNALYWISEYHLDGLRLDAIQNIKDDSPRHIVLQLNDNVQDLAREAGRQVCLIAETDTNEARITLPKSKGGWGLCAQWSDDFHHAIHTVLTGEHEGYYQDFGAKEQIVKALNEGFVFQGEHFKFWDAPRGTKPEGIAMPSHVIAIQNHDQVGNRALGDRLSQLVPRGAHKLAAALMLLAPHTPLLFMGEEYGEIAPFQFFTDFQDPDLRKGVSKGRREEFKDFKSFGTEFPDPQARHTFERSKLNWDLISANVNAGNSDSAAVGAPPSSAAVGGGVAPPPSLNHAGVLAWYRALLEIRHRIVMRSERTCRAELKDNAIIMQVPAREARLMVTATFPAGSEPPTPGLAWRQVLASQEDGYTVRVYERDVV
jgi:maltooligosyltrehalose trehalohydrolase